MNVELREEVRPLLSDKVRLIDIPSYPKERMEQLWTLLQTQDYAFDDTTRGDPVAFLTQLFIPGTLLFEVGDLQGIILAVGLQPKVNCVIHFAVWDQGMSLGEKRAIAVDVLRWLLSTYALNRVTGILPESNHRAVRFAISLGFKYEGTMRNAFLNHGVYENMYLYGMLGTEFNSRSE